MDSFTNIKSFSCIPKLYPRRQNTLDNDKIAISNLASNNIVQEISI